METFYLFRGVFETLGKSKMERFSKFSVVNYFEKHSILDVWQCSEYASIVFGPHSYLGLKAIDDKK